jgi:hypothetical protein
MCMVLSETRGLMAFFDYPNVRLAGVSLGSKKCEVGNTGNRDLRGLQDRGVSAPQCARLAGNHFEPRNRIAFHL